ncbi:MAG: DUF1538 domain-containing protein [Bacteroidales bacterium]|nr:DUF1538 domain-containing protein [Bacteroidales bacterium]MDD4672035.1 DUF1538 domain-containing protein [Bacteroidales bacterium]MDY0347624.1 DUF1538 domain-containing protein [Tenuifilaceae bacterium]
MKKRIKLPFKNAVGMLGGYAKDRIVEQIKLIAFIIFYLVAFQVVILRVPLADAWSIAGGIGLVVLGLALFLEGLILGLMPLGERVGVKMPVKFGILFISIFGVFLGFGSTIAEPAISSLRTAGAGVTAWDAPMLYMLLERHTQALVYTIGAGVGIAVVIGMVRFYYEFSIKPFIFILIPAALVFTFFLSFDEKLNSIIALAWDSGAVTTGAVTVPLVLALGIGVSRAASKNKATGGGFGIILLASILPVFSVLILGLALRSSSPDTTTEAHFFSEENRENALKLFDDEAALLNHAFTRGSEVGRKSFFADEALYLENLNQLANNPTVLKDMLGEMSFDAWLSKRASESERKYIASVKTEPLDVASGIPVSKVFKEESKIALQAVIPLTLLLLIVLLLFLREKLRFKDEFALGIAFTLVGMILLTSGIRLGLGPLGGQVGAQLPRAFSKEAKFIDSKMIAPFDTTVVFSTIAVDGSKAQFFNLTQDGKNEVVEFIPDNYDKENNIYEHVIKRAPLLGPNLTILGVLLVLLFAFGMGFGATMAEPALNALGITVEEMTVGAVKRSQIVSVVSLGVGIGLVLGVLRILYDIPLIWLIFPGYFILLLLTYFSEDEFTSMAWDCGGVTTGPVTVPLVLAMGLSIGGELFVVDGFGILACASFSPVLTVLIFGLITRARQKRIVNVSTEHDDE